MSFVQTHEPPETLRATRQRVLVVDDDVLQLRAIQRAMRRHAHVDLVVMDNAIDALLRIGSFVPDVVVLDVFMPGLDGIEACRRIKANPETAGIEVILTSAELTTELEADALRAGARAAIAKPVDVGTFIGSAVEDVHPVAAGTTMRGADLVVQMLADAGVEVIFGLPGGAISPVQDALLDSSLRVITTRHESGAMFAACGYAHATGKLAVAMVTSGPGALNAMTGLASAWCDGLPVLLLVGDVPRASQGKGVLQDSSAHGLQIVEMARHLTKLAAEVPRASALPHLLRRAIATAQSGRTGPVMLTLPFDVTTARVGNVRGGGTMTIGGVVEPQIIDEIAVLVRGAARPLILAGSGVRGQGGPTRLLAVAEALGCPVGTTPKGKGVFPENHPLALGVVGLGGHRSARDYLDSGVDVVVAIGTSLSEMATNGFSSKLQAPRALVHVDIDARQIGKSYEPTHAVVASAAEFLGALAEQLGGHEPRAATFGIARDDLPPSRKPGRIAAHDAIREIQDVLPHDAIYTIDSGEHFVFATHYLEIARPESFVAMSGLGSMGSSIGAAIGAKLAHPDRTVAAIVGDGCFAMNAFEIATAVAQKIPIRVFVFNDARFGIVEKGHVSIFGRTPDYGTTPLDVCGVARALGATAIRVDGVDQLRAARDMVSSMDGLVVVDIRLDPEITLAKNGRVAELARISSAPGMPAAAASAKRRHLN